MPPLGCENQIWAVLLVLLLECQTLNKTITQDDQTLGYVGKRGHLTESNRGLLS